MTSTHTREFAWCALWSSGLPRRSLNWRHVSNIAIAEELLAALERYTLFGMGASLTAFGAALDSGKTVKEAFASSSAKKA